MDICGRLGLMSTQLNNEQLPKYECSMCESKDDLFFDEDALEYGEFVYTCKKCVLISTYCHDCREINFVIGWYDISCCLECFYLDRYIVDHGGDDIPIKEYVNSYVIRVPELDDNRFPGIYHAPYGH